MFAGARPGPVGIRHVGIPFPLPCPALPMGTLKSNCTSMYFPNLLELSFRRVFALPKA